MPESITAAGVLFVLGPLVGAIPIANPSLLGVWSATRDEHLATIGAHRLAWAVLNLGFGLATIATAAGLAILALASAPDGARAAALVAIAIAYAVGGALWCALLAVRARTTPALADLVRTAKPTEPGESLLGAAQGGLFGAFVVATCVALTALGLTLLLTGGVAAPVAIATVVVGVGTAAWLLIAGDVVPAVLYLPTLLIGVALLAGWT
jgi:hypothetical protein